MSFECVGVECLDLAKVNMIVVDVNLSLFNGKRPKVSGEGWARRGERDYPRL